VSVFVNHTTQKKPQTHPNPHYAARIEGKNEAKLFFTLSQAKKKR